MMTCHRSGASTSTTATASGQKNVSSSGEDEDSFSDAPSNFAKIESDDIVCVGLHDSIPD